MYVVTGGAGFIGSNLLAVMEERGLGPLVAVDYFDEPRKLKNIAKRRLHLQVPPNQLQAFLNRHASEFKVVFHLGAISSTTERDLTLLRRVNVELSQTLWNWCSDHGVPFIYASSAATYGDGSLGFDDNLEISSLERLSPLNAYGSSKHQFDLWAIRQALDGSRPPQWAGLKFFNVYGPNEFHKAAQSSLVPQIFPYAARGEAFSLFRSHNPAYPDGGQMRDFIFVDDCCDVMLWLAEHKGANGLFNVGTGCARSFLDLASATYRALDRDPIIVFRDTPREIRDQYQYFTQARTERLRAAGYTKPFTSVEEGVAITVRRYLSQPDPYR